MTDYETLVEGHGVFCVYASSVRNSSWEAWEAFDGLIDTSSRWISADTYTGTEDAYSGSARLYSSAPLGEYVVLKMPYPIKLNKARVYALSGSPNTNNSRQGPERGEIWGSNDGVTWEHVTNYDFGDYQQEQWNEINNINSTKYYSQYGFIVTKKLNNTYTASGATQGDYVAISEIQYFGTPGPTTLDKGSLTLGRSLDVPRISRYDVDTETPRPEKLVVDLDTTVNSSPTDISGNGNHGTFTGTASYSAADKAFSFDGNSDYIEGNINNSGDIDFTVSFWVRRDGDGSGSASSFFFLGNEVLGQGIGIDAYNSGALYLYTFGGHNILDSDGTSVYFPIDKWVHVVASRKLGTPTDGVTFKFYVNGKDVTGNFTFGNGSGNAPTLPSNAPYQLGYRTDGTNKIQYMNGKISNFKLYNVVLEPSEVKKLYNLGRTGRSMVISDTAVGIGKAPEAQLDVRGVAQFGSIYAPGTIIQVKNNGGTTGHSYSSSGNSGTSGDISISYATGFKLSITPRSTKSQIHVNMNFLCYFQSVTTSQGIRAQVWRKVGTTYTRVFGRSGGTHDLHYYATPPPAALHNYLHLSFVDDAPNTLETCEYELRAALYISGGTLQVGNNSNQPATITLMEIGGE
jgi:hypothetical protein